MAPDLNHAREKFLRDGFVVLPSYLAPGEVDEINSRLEQLIRDPEKLNKLNAVHEVIGDVSLPRQLQDLQKNDDYFAGILNSGFRKIAEILLEDQVTGKTVEYFNKFPGVGKPTPPHQDGYYFMLEPSQALTVWIALEEIDEENGCMRYLRGSHKDGLRKHVSTKTAGFSQGISDYSAIDIQREVSVPAKPGDVLIHHSLTIHRANANNSSFRTRKALGLIYFATSAKENSKAKMRYQEELAKQKGRTQNIL